jgi:hypothetical protein
MQGTDQFAGLRELGIAGRGNFEGVGHFRIVVDRVEADGTHFRQTGVFDIVLSVSRMIGVLELDGGYRQAARVNAITLDGLHGRICRLRRGPDGAPYPVDIRKDLCGSTNPRMRRGLPSR